MAWPLLKSTRFWRTTKTNHFQRWPTRTQASNSNHSWTTFVRLQKMGLRMTSRLLRDSRQIPRAISLGHLILILTPQMASKSCRFFQLHRNKTHLNRILRQKLLMRTMKIFLCTRTTLWLKTQITTCCSRVFLGRFKLKNLTFKIWLGWKIKFRMKSK